MSSPFTRQEFTDMCDMRLVLEGAATRWAPRARGDVCPPGGGTQAAPAGLRLGGHVRIGLFITCVNDLLSPQTGIAVTTVLERLGHTVEFPSEQTCCGQMHANSGYAGAAVPLARAYGDQFAGYDAIVAPSGSCVAMIRDQYPRLAPETAEVAARTYELSELLVDLLGVTDVGARFPYRVTYHPTCHGLRLLRLGDRPLRLLRAVRDIDLVELPGAEECCGFGGTFAMKNADVSAAMLADKCDSVEGTGAQFLVAVDNSCLVHIGGGLSRRRSGTGVRHYAEILAATGTGETTG